MIKLSVNKLIFILPFIIMTGCASVKTPQSIPNIIFETDMGNDVDDALALDMIYKYLDQGAINLLAITSNKENKYSTEYIHLMNHWYGYPKIPVGRVINGADSENDMNNYAEHVALLKKSDSTLMFDRPEFNHDAIPDAVELYRKILSEEKDSSVTIVSVGFSTNLAKLLNSTGDQYSPLSGRELVAKKVRMLSVMAGYFSQNSSPEYNIRKDIPSAKLVIEEWPTPMVIAPNEAGSVVLYPATSILNDFNWVDYHPVVEAYKFYLEMPYDRPCWDLISLLYVVENSPEYFTESAWGNVSVDDKGITTFVADPSGNRAYLTVTEEQSKNLVKRFVELITARPEKLK